jgi:AcrR family transcriptional regulator
MQVDTVNIYPYSSAMGAKKQKKAYHHGDLRNSLLAAAEEVLRQKGADLSLREVAKVAGVSHTAPYRHFKDKTALLQALAAIGYQRLATTLRQVRKEFTDRPEEAMLASGQAYVELAVKHPEMTQLMFGGELELHSNIEDELIECSGDAFNALLELVDLCLEEGVFQPRDRMEIALANWSMVHGLSMLITGGQLQQYATDDDAVRGLARTLGEMLMRGLAASTGK